MSDVTRILNAIEQGDPSASDELLPLVYEELRALARQRLANEKQGQTLQATALVHEAYLRLVGNDNGTSWDNRGHFFAAAAEAMRRILVEAARRKGRLKAGGNSRREALLDLTLIGLPNDDQILDLDHALTDLEADEPRSAQLAKLRFFVGLTLEEAAETLGISARTAKRDWAYARASLGCALKAYKP